MNDHRKGRLDADRATLACIPERFRVTPTCEESSAYSIAVGASLGAMIGALERVGTSSDSEAYERAARECEEESERQAINYQRGDHDPEGWAASEALDAMAARIRALATQPPRDAEAGTREALCRAALRWHEMLESGVDATEARRAVLVVAGELRAIRLKTGAAR